MNLRPTSAIAGLAWIAVGAVGSPSAHADQPETDSTSPREPTEIEWLWVSTDLSYKRIVMRSFRADARELTAELISQDLRGAAPSLAAGVKLWFVVLGLRASRASLRDTSSDPAGKQLAQLPLWSIDAEIGFRSRLRKFEPHLMLAAGYSTFGSIGQAMDGLGQGLDLDGVNARVGAGLDYYVWSRLSLRLHATGEVLFVSGGEAGLRELAEPSDLESLNDTQRRILEADGSTAGVGYELGGGVAVHF